MGEKEIIEKVKKIIRNNKVRVESEGDKTYIYLWHEGMKKWREVVVFYESKKIVKINGESFNV